MKSTFGFALRLLLVMTIAWVAIRTVGAGEFQVLALSGTIVDSSQRPLPGCLVSVVSEFGRSAPAFTQEEGKFSLEASLPPDSSPTASSTPFLEIYWNRQLMFRQPLASLTMASAVPNNRQSVVMSSWPNLLHDGGRVVLQPIKLGK
jgi:hypothetical protein